MDLTPSTPQTSSGSSNDIASNVPDQDLDTGSECGWRDIDSGARPIFYMGDEEQAKYPSVSGLYKSLEGQKIRVGICAMAKKTNSKPMKEILARLGRFDNLQVDIFDESVILNEPVEAWPVVDALISFFSTGFPLQKAIQYKNLHKPFVVNDLEAQYAIKDRREVYKILVREGISHPRYAVMNRDGEEKGEFEESEDAIDVNGTQFQRPFVEKPVDAEDHNIYIYFPVSAGGGCQKLFRKVGSRSSVYSSCNRVRKAGSFIYEEFMPTDGTDVKVYTVGPDYAHAEARKSPALDGKVERDKDGKEVRYPVLLSAAEKMIARKVCLAFKQNVCGFDLLRTGGKSYVCDVNGFSFVKNSVKYYDDCANVLGTMIIRALAPQLQIPLILGAAPEDIPVVPTTSGSMFFDLFEKYSGYRKGHLKLKKPKQLQEVLDIARDLLNDSHQVNNPEVQEKKDKLRQLKIVLEMYGHFSGINRKVQLKYQPNGAPKKSSSEEDEFPKEPSLVLIVKWGGELTPAGKYQAEDLGKAFRTLYPGGQGEFETPGLGFLRLHSTFRHDLKIYASDEGRVQMTAAAFTKGLLALEGELTPILVSMVKSANTNGLLDKEGETSKYQHIVKEKLMEILNQDTGFNDDDIERLAPTRNSSLLNAIDFIKNPQTMCDQVYEMVSEITNRIKTLKLELKARDLKLYHGESWELLIRRWSKLEKDFKLKSGNYDISKIPDIYDCIKYDLQHNQKTLEYGKAKELFQYSKALADIVIPQEYGITVEEKVHISQSICTPLMRKIHSDLIQACQGLDDHSTRLNSRYSKGVASPERFVRTRLYFTSESHIHSLLNMLRYGGLCDEQKDEQWKKAMDFLSSTPELNYMTQINIMMFEDPSKEPSSPEKFHIELHFSPGAYTSCDKNVVNPVSSGYRTSFLVKQAKKMKGAVAKDSKEEGSLKLKDGVITEEISEETSDETVSGNNSWTKSDSSERPTVLNETSIQNLFRNVDKVKADDKTGADEDTAEEVKECDKTAHDEIDLVSADCDQMKEIEDGHQLETLKKKNSGDHPYSQVSTQSSSVTGKEDEENALNKVDTLDDTIVNESSMIDSIVSSEGSNEFPLNVNPDQSVDINDILATKGLSVESSVSSVYLTAEESDDCKPDVDDTGPVLTAEKQEILTVEDNPDPPSPLNTVDNVNSVDDTNITASDYDIKDLRRVKNDCAVQTEGDANEDTGLVSDNTTSVSTVQSKPNNVLPDSLNVECFVSTDVEEKQETVLKELKDEIEHENLEIKHELLFPVDINRVPDPKSPDPDIPEWDWGDEKVKDSTSHTDSTSSETTTRPHSAGTVKSLPISITPSDFSARRGSDVKKNFEENRSHSFEESESKDGGLGAKDQRPTKLYPFRYSLSDVFSAGIGDRLEPITLLEKHYRTIHLPINNDSHHSFSSLLYLNPDAFKAACSYDTITNRPKKPPPSNAFDGFNMVPSLKPLETLHNNLTIEDLDGFLCRATTTKFFTPVSSNVTTPLPSPRCVELNRTKSSGPSLPSSSNSSAGPSSPTTASTPIDFISRFKSYIMDSVKNEQNQIDAEADVSSESSLGSVGLKQEPNQTPIIPQKKLPQVSETTSAGPNPSDVLNMTSGHLSAFKAVTRSLGQKTQFVVTHVPEDSLDLNREKSESEGKKE